MSEHQKQTEFLKQCLLYDDTTESRKLAETMTQIQMDEQRVQRAMKVAGKFAVLAVVGVGYSVIFLDYYPEDVWGFSMHLFAQVFWMMGLVSIICLLTFAYLGSVHREELNQLHEECRETIAKFMDLRLGKPVSLPPEDSVVRQKPPERATSPTWETQHQANTQQTVAAVIER